MLRDYKLALTQGVPHVLDIAGDFYRVISAESGVSIRFDESVFVEREQGMGGSQDYSRVTIVSPKNQDVVLVFGFGVLYDDRGENVSKYPSCSPNTEDVLAIAGTIQTVVFESEFRYSTTLSLPLGVDSVRVNCSGIAGQGVWLHAGGSITLQTKTAIYVDNAGVSDVPVGVMVLGCPPTVFTVS